MRAAERDTMSAIIMDELVYGVTTRESEQYLLSVVQRFRDQGCDAVVLGCTELPLIINDDNALLPTLDSTRLLARAALRRAISGF